MTPKLFFISVILLSPLSQAYLNVNSEHFFAKPVLSQPKSPIITFELFEDGDNFCIMADLGGGDSGGGIWPGPKEQKYAPSTGSDREGKQESDDLDAGKENWESEPHWENIAFKGPEFEVRENIAHRILEKLNCESGRGIPQSSKQYIVQILESLITLCLEDGRREEALLIRDIVETLTRPQEI